MFSIVKQRNNQQQNQRLNHEPPHVKREKIANFKLCVNTIEIDWESDGENNQHQNYRLQSPLFIFKNKINYGR